MNAAGRTLTKGELDEAFSGLSVNDPITIDGAAVTRVESTGDLQLDEDIWAYEEEVQEVRELLTFITTEKLTKAEILARVKEYLS